MELLGGIEPESVPLLPPPAGATIAVNIRLHPPLLPPHITKELKVQFIMVLLEYVPI